MPDAKNDKRHYLLAGCVFVPEEAYVVTTVLGSCVSVCLWDPQRKIGGMNHYMLPLWNGEGLASPKYGNIAISKIVEKMMELGSDKKNLQAKLFGGSGLFTGRNTSLLVGERNILLARDMLKQESIPVVSADVGGVMSRKIVYDTCTGDVFVKKIIHRPFAQAEEE
jgi:chemotaxis protein CheD